MNPLKSIPGTIILGFVLAAIIAVILNASNDPVWSLVVWLHVFFGIIWIGLLYYFNFVQTPFFAETDPAVRTGAIQKLVPRALWWLDSG
mgnify:CR=1 FL=1